MPELTIGLDPGSSGGMACIINGTVEVMKFENATEADIAERLQDWAAGDCFAYIEKVGANRNRSKGNVAQGASSMFAFGQNYGFLRGILIASKVPFEEVQPVKWQAAFSLKGPSDESPTAKKNRHKAKAQQLFPKVKVTLALCDALLIAEFGRRMEART